MSENCNRTGAIVVIAPNQSLSQGIVHKFKYDIFDDDSFSRGVDLAIKDVRKNWSERWSEIYPLGATLSVFGWYYGYVPQEYSFLVKYIKVPKNKEFIL